MEDTLKKEGAEKKNYELAFLVNEESATRDLRRMVEQHEIDIQSESPLKKINLAYKIEHISEAYFGFLRISGEPAAMQSLARDLKAGSTMVRFLIVSMPSENRTSPSFSVRPQRPIARRAAPLPAKEIRQVKPLSNEALEKKIEEILQ